MNSGRITRADVKLTADIDLGGDVIRAGVDGYDYRGTFDGQGHSISVNWNVNDGSLSLFDNVYGGTIKNLRVKGNITVGDGYVEGLVSEVRNYTVISNCVIDLNIKGNFSWGYINGIAGKVWLGTLVIKDCVVKGSFTADSEEGKNRIRCFVGALWEDGKCTIENSLYIGSNNATDGSETFGPDGTNINNCYYLNACGKAQGTQITKEQLKSGEVAHKLQKGRSEHVWSQLIGTDNEPQPTAEAPKHVYKVDFTYNNEVKVTRYVNNKVGSMPTTRDILGSAYAPKIIYAPDFEGGFNGSTTVNADRTVAVTFGERIEIGSKDDWKTFCELVNNGHTKLDAKMTANVDLGRDIAMAGTNRRYSGTFDGQNHTLKINWNSGSNTWIAPFQTVDGATIKNLRTEGEINSSTHFLSGLIFDAYGTTNISNCVSAVNITSSYGNGGCDAAGMIECVRDNAKVTITDCVVKGKFHAATESGRRYMGGFVENQYGKCTLNNCLYIGENNATTGGHTFASNSSSGTTLNNCYYLNTCGAAQGTHVTADQLMSGEVAYKLQNGRNTQFWGQTLRTDDEPQLTDDAKKRVYEVKFSYNGNVVATRYATQGKAIYGALPNESDLLGALYDPAKNYSLTFDGGFNTGTAIDKDRTVAVTILVSNNFEIATKDDWKEFCRLVNSGKTKLDAKMIKDVNLEGDIAMVGTNDHKYAGTLDGQNHTLTFDWNGGNNKNLAPFRSADGATIRNLRTKGKIVSKNNWLSGLIDESYGNITISNCVSDVALTSSHNDNVCGAAGMISYIYKGDVTITDCVVKGSINATTGTGQKGMGGFVYAQLGTCTLTNCLYIATNNADNTNSDCHTFAKNATVTNCYYLNACGTAQGIKITEEQLKSGEVARLLQGDRTDQFWGQNLGTDNEPQLTDDATKHVYKVDFTYNGNAAAARYANKGGHIFGALPTAQNLLGMAYSHSYYYALTFADDFSANTAVDADRTVAVTIARKAIDEELEIASKDDWKIFCDAVSRGKRNFDVKMTADVDLGKDIIMIGEQLLVYSGTFDGQGHTLKIDWNAGTQNEIAPFKYLGETTIKNLTVKGRINADGYKLAGMVVNAMSSLNVSNCVSDVDITSDYDGESHMGGIVNYVFHNAQSVRFIDCIVKGKLHATKEAGRKSMGGFIGYRGGNMPCYFENCLYIGENNAIVGLDGYTFGPNPVLTNSHYLKVCGIAQGEQVTEKQLKNGHVSELLQVDRKDACHWAQVLGDMPSLYREADKAKPNYIYYDTANKRWTCDDFRLTDGTPLPIGLDFLAAKATYERDFTAGKATVCLPYDLPSVASRPTPSRRSRTTPTRYTSRR
ncbi:peptidase M26 [Segatella baroniae]|uniref:peptidase M26 n=1 Tax=Segatella baroniae TaxID=305719 RepID=UPI000A947837|nr:peptidase M26 [Segatella baroniae]